MLAGRRCLWQSARPLCIAPGIRLAHQTQPPAASQLTVAVTNRGRRSRASPQQQRHRLWVQAAGRNGERRQAATAGQSKEEGQDGKHRRTKGPCHPHTNRSPGPGHLSSRRWPCWPCATALRTSVSREDGRLDTTVDSSVAARRESRALRALSAPVAAAARAAAATAACVAAGSSASTTSAWLAAAAAGGGASAQGCWEQSAAAAERRRRRRLGVCCPSAAAKRRASSRACGYEAPGGAIRMPKAGPHGERLWGTPLVAHRPRPRCCGAWEDLRKVRRSQAEVGSWEPFPAARCAACAPPQHPGHWPHPRH